MQPFEQKAAADKLRAAADRARVLAAHPPKQTAYSNYVKSEWAAFTKTNPTAAFADVGRALAARWKLLSDAQKQASTSFFFGMPVH